jgi:hypothetical protein
MRYSAANFAVRGFSEALIEDLRRCAGAARPGHPVSLGRCARPQRPLPPAPHGARRDPAGPINLLVRSEPWIVVEALAYRGWRIPIMPAFVCAQCSRKLFMKVSVSEKNDAFGLGVCY